MDTRASNSEWKTLKLPANVAMWWIFQGTRGDQCQMAVKIWKEMCVCVPTIFSSLQREYKINQHLIFVYVEITTWRGS